MYHIVEKQHEHQVDLFIFVVICFLAHLPITQTQTSYIHIHTRNGKRWLGNEKKKKNSISLSIFIQTHEKKGERKKDELKKKEREKKRKTEEQTNTKKRELCLLTYFVLSLFLMIICCTLDHVSKFFTWHISESTVSPSKERIQSFIRAFQSFLNIQRYISPYPFYRSEQYQVPMDPRREFRLDGFLRRVFIHQDSDHRVVNKSKVTLQRSLMPVTIENEEYPDISLHSN